MIRHGETDWNIEGRLQGREDVPLNRNGLAQAEQCGRALARLELGQILSSPLSRARVTAEIIAAHVGKLTVGTDVAFTERDFGALSGKKPPGMDIFNPGEDTPGLEPLDMVSGRFIAGICRYAEKGGEAILVVSHGGAINAVLREVSNGETGTGKIRLKNASVNILEWDAGQLTLLACNLSPEDV